MWWRLLPYAVGPATLRGGACRPTVQVFAAEWRRSRVAVKRLLCHVDDRSVPPSVRQPASQSVSQSGITTLLAWSKHGAHGPHIHRCDSSERSRISEPRCNSRAPASLPVFFLYQVQQFYSEMEILANARHDNIVRFLGGCNRM